MDEALLPFSLPTGLVTMDTEVSPVVPSLSSQFKKMIAKIRDAATPVTDSGVYSAIQQYPKRAQILECV
jgi:hypothetical protein